MSLHHPCSHREHSTPKAQNHRSFVLDKGRLRAEGGRGTCPMSTPATARSAHAGRLGAGWAGGAQNQPLGQSMSLTPTLQCGGVSSRV